jgi:hypothetical protein
MIAPALGPSLKKGLEMSILGVIMLNGYQLNSTLKSKVITLAMDTNFLWKEPLAMQKQTMRYWILVTLLLWSHILIC